MMILNDISMLLPHSFTSAVCFLGPPRADVKMESDEQEMYCGEMWVKDKRDGEGEGGKGL